MDTVQRATMLMFSLLLISTSAACGQEIAPGLYLRTTYAFGNLSLSTILIGSGNKIAFDPKNGVDPFDFSTAAKDPAQKVGTFTVEGNKLAVAWAGKPAETLSVEFEKGQLSAFDGGLVTKADAYKSDQKLDHTYGGSASTANVSSAMTLKFSSDGSYSLSRLGGVSGIPGNVGIAEKSESGKYKLSGNTLTLTPSSGPATKHTVLPFNTALDPAKAKISDDHLIFDGANLKREK